VDDWLHLHYRDKALMLARGVTSAEFFHSALCTGSSHSAGRQMSAHLSAPALNLLSLVGPVGNNALQAVGVAQEVKNRCGKPLVVCSVGDGTSQQGEFLEAVAEAVRSQAPVLFWIEDNGLAISTRTGGRTLFDLPDGPARDYLGLPIHRLDGRDPVACLKAVAPIIEGIRQTRGPALAVFQVERLTHHTNADDERVYRAEADRARLRTGSDPVETLSDALVASGVSKEALAGFESQWMAEVRSASEEALRAPNPETCLDALEPRPGEWKNRVEYSGAGGGDRFSMLEALREVLRFRLETDPRVSLYGQDLEDPKGDVFGLTRGLSTAHPGRVRNSPLAESTIAGVGVGRALAGGRPVACIQFADFLPIAVNQIASEMGSMFWRTQGGWRAPVILMAPCGGYRPGLGPFHAQTFESIVAHVPGVDVVMPSTAADAAGLLNAAFESGRPTVFLYPKVCLNDPALATSRDLAAHWVRPGVARRVRTGDGLTLVTWGATVPLVTRAADLLQTAGVSVDLLDLRSLSPWDSEAVIASVERTGRLVVVHEDNLTCGFGAEVLATVSERAQGAVRARRVTRPDTYVPCNYVNQLEVLPGIRRILEAAADLCDLELGWETPAAGVSGVHVLEAVGSSPADQTVSVVDWKVSEGQDIEAGALLADCEADKATFELRAPVAGVISGLLAVDEKVPVGSALARIATRASEKAFPRRIQVDPIARIRRRAVPVRIVTPVQSVETVRDGRSVVGISTVAGVPAGREVTNAELIQRFPGRSAADIYQRTGIESRRLLAPGESVVTLAAAAARRALVQAGLAASDLDAIFVSTSSPVSLSPSLACLIHFDLSKEGPIKDLPAVDLLAACTGYLYALQSAFDFCQSRPDARILVVTAEAMSTYTDPNDFDTAIVFADAATATLVAGPASSGFERSQAFLHRPVLSARGEDGTILNHGRRERPNVNMDGLKVFPMAVRQLIALMKQACEECQVPMQELEYIIPHQANGRILEAVDQRLRLPKGRLINRVRNRGNTSSSSIPLVLSELLTEKPVGRAGLCAFGGGFTFGAAVIEFS
jgi:2-oxoisovalerate dehydrogenase E1 component